MKIIKIDNTSKKYTRHGIGYTEHDGYQGTSSNGLTVRNAILIEYHDFVRVGEQFMIELNGKFLKNGAIFNKTGFKGDLSLLNY